MKNMAYLLAGILFFLNGCASKNMSSVHALPVEPKPQSFTEGDFILKTGMSLHYYYDEKPGDFLVVYLHGGPISDSSVFRGAVGDEFFDLVHGSVLYIDEMGSGLSQKNNLNPADFNFKNEITGLHEVIQSFLNNRNLILMGHSFGGTLAVHYAQAFPDEAQAYILSAPWLNDALCREGLKSLSDEAIKIQEQELNLSKNYKSPKNSLDSEFSSAWYKNEGLHDADYLPLLRFIHQSTLVISGELDANVTKNQIEVMKPYLPMASFKYIPKAGHKAYLTQKNEYIKVINEFMTHLK